MIDIPDPRIAFLDKLSKYETAYITKLNELKKLLTGVDIHNLKNLTGDVCDQMTDEICKYIEALSSITNQISSIVIDVKLNDVVKRMISPETDSLDLKIEYKLTTLHIMFTEFNEYSKRIRTWKKRWYKK
jgi:hypothetical protein